MKIITTIIGSLLAFGFNSFWFILLYEYCKSNNHLFLLGCIVTIPVSLAFPIVVINGIAKKVIHICNSINYIL